MAPPLLSLRRWHFGSHGCAWLFQDSVSATSLSLFNYSNKSGTWYTFIISPTLFEEGGHLVLHILVFLIFCDQPGITLPHKHHWFTWIFKWSLSLGRSIGQGQGYFLLLPFRALAFHKNILWPENSGLVALMYASWTWTLTLAIVYLPQNIYTYRSFLLL